MNKLPLGLDVMTDDKREKEWKAILVIRIDVLAQGIIKIHQSKLAQLAKVSRTVATSNCDSTCDLDNSCRIL